MQELGKETTGVTVTRVLLSILAFFLIFAFTDSVILSSSILKDSFWKDLLHKDEIRTLLEDALRPEMARDLHIDEDDVDDDMLEDYLDLVSDDYVDFIIKGDSVIDEDAYYDFFDEYEDELFADFEGSARELDDLKEQYIDEFKDSLIEARDDFESSDNAPFWEMYTDALRNNKIVMAVTGTLILVIIAVLLLIHRNKMRPVRALGIAMASSEFINLCVWAFFLFVVRLIKAEAEEESDIIKILLGYTDSFFIRSTLIVLGLMLMGIAAIIIGAVGVGRINNQSEEL
ncbi:MAG: hypothetical protein IJ757_07675 [Clostridiales bacterium]|nr:hypothetical protein [Clostridiales bacterium]